MEISKQDLMNHFGHKIVIARYGSKKNPHDMTIQCETCNEVLYSTETQEEAEDEQGIKMIKAGLKDGTIKI